MGDGKGCGKSVIRGKYADSFNKCCSLPLHNFSLPLHQYSNTAENINVARDKEISIRGEVSNIVLINVTFYQNIYSPFTIFSSLTLHYSRGYSWEIQRAGKGMEDR